MDRKLEKKICLGTGIPLLFLSPLISVSNVFVLLVLYKNPLRCFRKPFSVFLVFISSVDLFNGVVVCCGDVVVRLICAFSDGNQSVPQEGDIVTILEYIGLNRSILLVTAMSCDRFAAVVYPHCYLRKVKPQTLVLCNTFVITFSVIFASIQLSDISIDVYHLLDRHFNTTFPLATNALAYLGIFIFLRKRSQVHYQKQTISAGNATLNEMRRSRTVLMERKFAKTSFCIVICLVFSLMPYYFVSILGAKCYECRNKGWFFELRESSVVILFFNSVVNPFLTGFRINELRQSMKVVLRLRLTRVDQGDFRLRTFQQNNENILN